MPASPIADTFGIWLIAQFFQAILFGMGLLQVYLYFFWYPKDHWGIKATSVQTGTFFAATYGFFITDFGHPEILALFPWTALAQLLALIISFLANSLAFRFFAHTIYLLHKRRKIFPAIIIILSLVGLGGGTAQIVLACAASNTQAALSLACDILITVGLCWRLNESRTGIQSTNKLLNFLIMTAVNRGVLTMVTALLNMVLFLTQPGTFYFMLLILLSGKFYMNSMLAMLNTRHHAHSIGNFGTMVDHISMTPSSRNGQVVSVDVTVSQETRLDFNRDNDKMAF
ncbi:hypothetical protein R3P38DRAFT_3116981 [Favolaschia claudopus]|uniref:DUF6534 domain-containing protein n=1 Tax=Favolaschia claudopus TaxID=2862362 RepID=A0AAV9ZFJ6_9AGAR